MSASDLLVCPPMDTDRRKRMYHVIDQWTSSAAMQQLVRIFGGAWQTHWSLQERLNFLEAFSDIWDFRRGVERLDIMRTSLEPEKVKEVEEAAKDLGLTVAVPPRLTSYDYLLVLGGVALSCKLRVEMDIKTEAVVLLGASRSIPENERVVANSFAPGAATEFDMLNTAAEMSFSLTGGFEDSVNSSENPNLISIIRRYRRVASTTIVSLCAPSSDPSRRANTEDAYAFLAKVMHMQHGQSLLICTSQIYFPFHSMGAMQMLALPYNVVVEVVGFPIERASVVSLK